MDSKGSARNDRVVRKLLHSGRNLTEKPVRDEFKQTIASISFGRFKLTREVIQRRRNEICNSTKENPKKVSAVAIAATMLLLSFLITSHFSDNPKLSADELAVSIWELIVSLAAGNFR